MVKFDQISEGEPIADAFDQVGMGRAKVLVGIAAAGLISVILVDIVAMGRVGFALCRSHSKLSGAAQARAVEQEMGENEMRD
ncbi:hypothetical protein [Yimella sp. cx-51]|nr:hypothetical protein [Yimella sp. cx-51]